MPLHRELLSQAIANLIDNALRHAAAGGAIDAAAARRGDGLAIRSRIAGRGSRRPTGRRRCSRFGRLDTRASDARARGWGWR